MFILGVYIFPYQRYGEQNYIQIKNFIQGYIMNLGWPKLNFGLFMKLFENVHITTLFQK